MSKTAGQTKQTICVRIGQQELQVGKLIYVKSGAREFSQFSYSEEWLKNPNCFEVSPDLDLTTGYKARRAQSKGESCFHFAFADTEPDAWGRRVINRAHAKARKKDRTLSALTELDYLIAVDDYSRIGALRLCDEEGNYHRVTEEGKRATPPLVDLKRIYQASRALEQNKETVEDLRYLQGRGTSLGGLRPKCTMIDADGTLAIGKLPSVNDERDVTRGEVLALRLAGQANIVVAGARIEEVDGTPVAIITRFDRTKAGNRIHYLSAGSMLQINRDNEHSYTEVVDIMRSKCADPVVDAKALWRLLVFNLLITNIDDHLRNLGFLYAGRGLWRLSPVFDLNPFPDKDRESKTWLSEDTGPITDLSMLMDKASYFYLDKPEALQVLGEVYFAVKDWRTIALSPEIGLQQNDLEAFTPAFEHEAMEEAEDLLKN
ncbi:MAG: HipA domain-containing protein [Sedimenticola sp.]